MPFVDLVERTEGEEVKDVCCICKHFRMWKPSLEWRTVKKIQVNPLDEQICENYCLRKGLREV
jgi:hypothetical protein